MNTNRYTISADSRRWWWPSAAAGTAAVAAVAAIASVPANAGIPDTDPGTGTGTGATRPATSYTVIKHPCFMVQPRWNAGMDGPQPVCRTLVRSDRDPAPDRSRVTAPRAGATTWIVAEPVGP